MSNTNFVIPDNEIIICDPFLINGWSIAICFETGKGGSVYSINTHALLFALIICILFDCGEECVFFTKVHCLDVYLWDNYGTKIRCRLH